MPDLRILLVGAMALLIATYGASTDRTASPKAAIETTGSVGRLGSIREAGPAVRYEDAFKLDR